MEPCAHAYVDLHAASLLASTIRRQIQVQYRVTSYATAGKYAVAKCRELEMLIENDTIEGLLLKAQRGLSHRLSCRCTTKRCSRSSLLRRRFCRHVLDKVTSRARQHYTLCLVCDNTLSLLCRNQLAIAVLADNVQYVS